MPVPSGSAVDSVMLNDSPTEFVPEIVKTASPSSEAWIFKEFEALKVPPSPSVIE